MGNRLAYDGFHKIEIVSSDKGELREKLLLNSATAALVIDDRGYICLVRQYRPTIGMYTWEIPAGILDKPGLTPEETVLEELKEECDISTEQVLSCRKMKNYFMLTGSSDAKMHLYQVDYDGVGENKTIHNDDVEGIAWFNLAEIEKMIKDDLIIDPKTIIACLLSS